MKLTDIKKTTNKYGSIQNKFQFQCIKWKEWQNKITDSSTQMCLLFMTVYSTQIFFLYSHVQNISNVYHYDKLLTAFHLFEIKNKKDSTFS